jgi:hypothetical protein
MNERALYGPKTAEEAGFIPPAEAVKNLGSLAGDISRAEGLLDDSAAPPSTNGQPEIENEPTATDSGFEVSIRARKDLGDPTVIEEIEELAEGDEPPTTYEVTRESIVIGVEHAIERWHRYGGAPGLRLPRDPEHFQRFLRDYEGTVDQLTRIKLDMIDFGKTTEGRTIGGHNMGRSLSPLLVPWEFFRSHVEGTTTSAIRYMRSRQGIEEHALDDPAFFDRNAINYYHRSEWRDADRGEYLNDKFMDDGWWGIMLVQTGKAAGQSRRKPPSELRERRPYMLNGYRSDSFGIYEWLALTLQEDPGIFAGSRNLMLGNYTTYKWNSTDYNGTPYGVWDDKNQRFAYGWLRDDYDYKPNDYVARIAIHPADEKEESE